MTVIVKGEIEDPIFKAILQVDESDTKGLFIKGTSPNGNTQIQFQLSELEVKRLAKYFNEKEEK